MRQVRRLVLAAILAAGAWTMASAATTSGIAGVVLDATCYGPCSVPPKPLPRFRGENLVVVVRRLPELTLVARLQPVDGSFVLTTTPGLYRVRAIIREPGDQNCWTNSTRKVVVADDMFTRVRLRVANLCVL